MTPSATGLPAATSAAAHRPLLAYFLRFHNNTVASWLPLASMRPSGGPAVLMASRAAPTDAWLNVAPVPAKVNPPKICSNTVATVVDYRPGSTPPLAE
jgi:hypothetical protein